MKYTRLSSVILFAAFSPGVFAAEADAKDTSARRAPPVEVVFETNQGPFTLKLNPEKAPNTVANFLVYVDEGFYDNTLFHRVIPRFVVQGGGYEKGMKLKRTHSAVENESDNGLTNVRGTVSMARRRHPDSATSQFFINLSHNPSLDYRDDRPGYTVFGKVSEGMEVIDNIVAVPTKTSGRYKDVPKEDVSIVSARRKSELLGQDDGVEAEASAHRQGEFVAGEDYVVLDTPVPTRDSSKVEVVEMFSYGCPHCYEFEPVIREWGKQQDRDVDFWYFPAVWNESMKLYARAFYAARELNVAEIIHHPLFTAVVVEQGRLSNEGELAEFFSRYGVDKKAFAEAFSSSIVDEQVKQAEARVRSYKPAGVPEIIVNGKYRVDRMRAGGQREMLAVVDFLIEEERAMQEKLQAAEEPRRRIVPLSELIVP